MVATWEFIDVRTFLIGLSASCNNRSHLLKQESCYKTASSDRLSSCPLHLEVLMKGQPVTDIFEYYGNLVGA